jgi:ABC-type nitrate/sulfonate/bicarbonate transport system substrate-binding protein
MISRCYYNFPNPSFRRKPESRRSVVWITTAIAVLTLGFSNIAHGEKIRTAIPQANLNYLSIHVADARGFFKDEGLDNETVVISGPLSIAALLSGDVDFSGAGGSGMRAALKGAPLKGIYFQSSTKVK